MTMKLTILGSGTCVPSIRRAPSGYLLQTEDKTILFDGGSGTLGRIAKTGVIYSSIDTVIYTHFHVDHTAELLPLLFARKYDPSPLISESLNIYGPEGMLDHMRGLETFAGSWVYDKNYISVTELKPSDNIKLGGCTVGCHSTYHQPNSLGYRVESVDGKVFSYTGDTDEGERLIPLLDNADIAVAECSFPDRLKTRGHLTPSEIGRIAQKANIKKLIITHLYPEMDKIDPIPIMKLSFNGEIEIAEDLKEYQI